MSDIIVFISPKFEQEQSAKIADLFRIHNINTTNNIHEATVILTQNNLADISMLLPMEDLRIEAEHKMEFVPHILEPISLPKKNKKTYTKYQIQKNFNKVKQATYQHCCFNRGIKR